MPNLIRLSGPWGPLLALLALVVVLMVIRATVGLIREPFPSPSLVRERLSAILFWGFVSAVLGFLGQCHGTYTALSSILGASEISMAVVAEGFVISFVPTLFGLGILAFALVCWGCLKLLSLGRPSLLRGGVALLALLGLFSGCSGAPWPETPGDIGQGVWMLDAGQDRFLWEFSRTSDRLTCIVHDLRGTVKLNETPCLEADLEAGEVTVSMDTGVRLEGTLDLDERRIRGRLVYPAGGGQEAELHWAPKDDFPVLTPFPGGETTYVYRRPEDRGDGFGVADASDVGIDPGALEATVQSVLRGEAGVLHSLLVARAGQLVLEEYFHGYGPDDLHQLASCTKSISSLLVGLAIQNGAIESVEVPVWTFFPYAPETLGKGWDKLTLRDLLTMTMALDWSPNELQNLHGTGPATFREILSRDVVGEPGIDWEYASINVNLIAGILRDATGVQADAFAAEKLFGPLGISVWEWEGMKTEGYPLMDGSLRLRPRDMARIGLMVLAGGRWQGKEVVSQDWIRSSTARLVDAGSASEGYGYLWWTMEAAGPDGQPVEAVFANGWGSQFIVLFPDLDLLVVTTGGNEFNGKHMAVAETLVGDLLPGVRPLSTPGREPDQLPETGVASLRHGDTS